MSRKGSWPRQGTLTVQSGVVEDANQGQCDDQPDARTVSRCFTAAKSSVWTTRRLGASPHVVTDMLLQLFRNAIASHAQGALAAVVQAVVNDCGEPASAK